jgi:hypothetical protein
MELSKIGRIKKGLKKFGRRKIVDKGSSTGC